MNSSELLEKYHSVYTAKIACLYPVKVDATWKVPGIELGTVRTST